MNESPVVINELCLLWKKKLRAMSPQTGQMYALLIIAQALTLGIVTFERLTRVFIGRAAAQMGDVGSAMCGTGLGQLIGVALAAVSLYLVVKGAFRGAIAFDKMGSSRSETQYEGKRTLVGAGKTTAGAFIPPAFGSVLELIGVNTVSCIDFTTGILGMITLVPL